MEDSGGDSGTYDILWEAQTGGSGMGISSPVVGDINGDSMLEVVVGDKGGKVYCIAGDAVFFHENLTRGIPIGATYSRADAIRSMQKLQRLADCVIPGHDPEQRQSGAQPVVDLEQRGEELADLS